MKKPIIIVIICLFANVSFSQGDCGISILYKGSVDAKNKNNEKILLPSIYSIKYLKNTDESYRFYETHIESGKYKYLTISISSEYCSNFDIEYFFKRIKIYKVKVIELLENSNLKVHEIIIPIEKIHFEFSKYSATIELPDLKI